MARRPHLDVRPLVVSLVSAALLVGCSSGGSAGASGSGDAKARTTITLYTSLTQTTVDAVISAYHDADPSTTVTVFRAATGALNARIAADKRSGGLKADVIWVSDPLTMHGYDTQGLLERYTAPSAKDLPAQYRTASFAGAAVLYLVLVYRNGVTPVPTNWSNLTDAAYKNAVAVPDPGFAGSAMGALGYFGKQQGFGLDFYRSLKANGGVQVNSPDDVVTGVAQGRYKIGMTIADSALAAAKKGSPIAVVWPAPGAVAIYSPIGVAAKTKHRSAAEAFDDFVLSKNGQHAIAASGREPSLPGVHGIEKPASASVVSPDWPAVFADEAELLDGYRKIFGS
jgi:iron(III) transport system substrate-binding protein